MWEHVLHSFQLLRPELECRDKVQRVASDSLVVDLDLAACVFDESGGCVVQAAWQEEVVVESFVVGGDDPGDVPR